MSSVILPEVRQNRVHAIFHELPVNREVVVLDLMQDFQPALSHILSLRHDPRSHVQRIDKTQRVSIASRSRDHTRRLVQDVVKKVPSHSASLDGPERAGPSVLHVLLEPDGRVLVLGVRCQLLHHLLTSDVRAELDEEVVVVDPQSRVIVSGDEEPVLLVELGVGPVVLDLGKMMAPVLGVLPGNELQVLLPFTRDVLAQLHDRNRSLSWPDHRRDLHELLLDVWVAARSSSV
mmetsp:Transcript_27527/g.89662  ORF Transcript_27527/g.89662 Transcript_27527/m.89662 type:complete len:233 (-) Transcript_27527:802-1500(-)